MEVRKSEVGSQKSGKNIIVIFAVFISVIFSYHTLSPLNALANGEQEKGTLIIPKRPDSTASAAKPSDVSAAVGKLQIKFDSIKDIRGTFVQKSYIKDLEDIQEYSGTFYIKKPSQMMWEYALPRDEKVLINNQETWIYKKSENQVFKTTFTKESYSQVPIALLTSLEHIREDFDISEPEANALQLVPKRTTGFIKSILLETAEGPMPIKMLTLFDTYGNIIMIELAGVRTNTGISDDLFKFTVPAGAEVYDTSK